MTAGDGLWPGLTFLLRRGRATLGADVLFLEACAEKTTVLYNALMDLCVDAKDCAAATRVMHKALEARMAHVVAYNTLVKAQIQGCSC